MEKEQSKKKYFIFAIVVICIILIVSVLLYLSDDADEENNIIGSNIMKENFIDVNETEENNTTQNNTNSTLKENSLNESTEENTEENNVEKSYEYYEYDEDELNFDIQLSTYFIAKYCLDSYYNSSNLTAKISLLDEEAKDFSYNIVSSWIDDDYYKARFAIDEIYTQELSDNMNLILVYYRYTTDNQNCNSSVIAIKVNTSNNTFSMFPYEFLQAKNYTDYRDGDKIILENNSSINVNSYNQYDEDEIDTTGLACTEELLEKLKFDILVDNEHLYDILDDEYKEQKFSTLEDFEQYVEENKESIIYEQLTKYRVTINTEYVEFSGITNNNRYLVFDVPVCLMDYTVYLDSYTIVLSDAYEDSVPTWQAPYCLERIFNAINEKDYSFVYEHLNPVQKNNYYRTEEAFIEYIQSICYDNNTFEIDDEYMIISDYVYQYTVYVTNNENTKQTKTLTMTVTVEDDTDFVVAIN